MDPNRLDAGRIRSLRPVYLRSLFVAAIVVSTVPLWSNQSTGGRHEWPMHAIDNPNERLPNGLDAADVNGDGYLDYVTNYEGGKGLIRIAFHPGADASFASIDLAANQLWPAVTVAEFRNAENAAVGDMDGDGLPDVVVAHGNQGGSNQKSGVAVVWCESRNRVYHADGWLKGGDVPGTVDRGHYLYIKTADVNADGLSDIVVGGRREGSSASTATREGPATVGALAGLKWIEAPQGVSADRRDLSKWNVHEIDPTLYGGYGFRLGDIDMDGDADIAISSKDWDTPKGKARLYWYENPGPGSNAQREPWPRYEIHDGDVFYTKTQVDIGDLDGDGRNDLVIQSEDQVYLFRNQGGSPIQWERIMIPKPDITKFRTRPIRLADINGDGKLDIIGALIHNEGYLPADKAAVFWMEYEGEAPGADNWTTHVIKWGDGYDGKAVFVGEKWDQMMFEDIDRDGDLDIVANVEEYHGRGPARKVYLAVVWFENVATSAALPSGLLSSDR